MIIEQNEYNILQRRVSNWSYINDMWRTLDDACYHKEQEVHIKSINDLFDKIKSGEKVFLQITNYRSLKNGSIGYINVKKSKIPTFDTYDAYNTWRYSCKIVISFGNKDIPDIIIKDVNNCLLVPGDQDKIVPHVVTKKTNKEPILDKKDSLGKTILVGQACAISNYGEIKYGFVTKITELKTVYITRIGESNAVRIFNTENRLIVFDKGNDTYKKIVTLKLKSN